MPLIHAAYFLPLLKLQPKIDVLIPFLRYEKELETELLLLSTKILHKSQDYFLVENLTRKPIWARDWWPNSRSVEFENKNQAVKYLKSLETLGVNHSVGEESKMTSAIRKELRELKLKRIKYEVPSKFNFKYFSWLIRDARTLIVCDRPHSRFPLGWHEFNEDKETPPNRAYLKIWEVLVLDYIHLKHDDVVIDLGSSPGGWSWALSDHVKKVYSVDRAALDPKIATRKNIEFSIGDAFSVDPRSYSDCSWLFSDIICTPDRLLELITKWQQESSVKNYVCTVKFKGECDFNILKEFLRFPGSQIIHLYQNKNEVTWIKREKI